jgi:hypothetical protein
VHNALPYGLAVVRLFDGHGLGERGGAAVLGFNGFLYVVGHYRPDGCLVTLPHGVLRPPGGDSRSDESYSDVIICVARGRSLPS